MEYDKVLEFLNKGIYEKLFKLKLTKFKTDCIQIKFTKTLLKKFEIEYEQSRKIIDEYWSKYYEKKRLLLETKNNGI